MGLFKQNLYFKILLLLWIIVGIVLIVINKNQIHLAINSYNHPAIDAFFYYTTALGDGLTAAIVSLLLIVYNWRHGILISISWISASLFTQFLKHFVFTDSIRPFLHFDKINLHLVDGLVMNTQNSFPSGHATTVFALTFALSLLTTSKVHQLMLLLIALITAFSRVYLSQHFLVDIYFASLIAAIFTILTFLIFTLLPKRN